MFVSRLKELRIERGWTQSVLAKKSHITQMQISNIERNKKSTTLHTLENIIKALNTDGNTVCMHDLLYYQCDRYDKCTLKGKEFSNCCRGDCNKKSAHTTTYCLLIIIILLLGCFCEGVIDFKKIAFDIFIYGYGCITNLKLF